MQLLTILLIFPISSALLAFFAGRSVTRVAAPLLSWLQVAVLVSICQPLFTGAQQSIVLSDDFAVDRIAAYFLVLTNCIAAFSFTHSRAFFKTEESLKKSIDPQHEKLYYAAASLFVAAMSFVFVCDNLGFLWISIEATTLFSALLVYYSRDKHALEATWKYLIVCSVGIAFALLGTVLIFASSQQDSMTEGSICFHTLIKHGSELQPKLLQLGYIFCLLGYGTKAGVFPLHSWLPDAHSEAPAPASAMLSGALLNCALFAIMRITDLVKLTPHHDLATILPMDWGAITAVAAALLLVYQSGIKRMWAYSSIENVGIMLIAIGLGSHALFFLQALNHSVAKVALFLLSGNIIQECGTKELSKIRGVLKSSPVLGILFAIAAAAVTGTPPFGAFIAEWMILARNADAHNWAIICMLLAALALSFVAICMHVGRLLMGPARPNQMKFSSVSNSIVPAILCVCALVLGMSNLPLLLVTQL